jgi:tRNA pseudouridine55 synthase
LLDKPQGLSSNQALQRTKRLFQAAKAGHTGSLDPLATGMLPICFGAATSLCGHLLDAGKSYRVVARLGVATATGDAEGEITQEVAVPAPRLEAVRSALTRFLGEIEQVPPMYSALKRDGVPLYKLARSGVEVPREPRRVVIDAIELEAYDWPHLQLAVDCSKGTYIRTLVEDIAVALGTVGHVRNLRRLYVTPFRHNAMIPLDSLEALAANGLAALDAVLLPMESALPDWSSVFLGSDAAARLVHGQSVPVKSGWTPGKVKVYGPNHDLIAFGEVSADGRLAPTRVFAAQVLGAAPNVS